MHKSTTHPYLGLIRTATATQDQTASLVGSMPMAHRHMMGLRRRSILQFCGTSVVALIGGCSSPGSGLPPLPPVASGAYHLGPGDHVRLITLESPELTSEFRVSDSGDLALPLIGTVRAADRTPKELEIAIADRLTQAKLFRDPSVSVEVVQYRPIFVLGEVNKPGQYSYQPGMTAVTAVAIAGGFTYRAVDSVFSVVRINGDKTIEGKADRQAFLQPGDVLTVFERHL